MSDTLVSPRCGGSLSPSSRVSPHSRPSHNTHTHTHFFATWSPDDCMNHSRSHHFCPYFMSCVSINSSPRPGIPLITFIPIILSPVSVKTLSTEWPKLTTARKSLRRIKTRELTTRTTASLTDVTCHLASLIQNYCLFAAIGMLSCGLRIFSTRLERCPQQ